MSNGSRLLLLSLCRETCQQKLLTNYPGPGCRITTLISIKKRITSSLGDMNTTITKPSILCVTQLRAFMPVYIEKSGDLVGCYRCLTHRQTAEYSATQRV